MANASIRLEENFEALMKAMSALIALRNNRGERQTNNWLQDVVDKERVVDAIQNDLKSLPKGLFSVAARNELNKRVNLCHNSVKTLLERADEVSELIENFMNLVIKEHALKFSHWDLKRYTSDFSNHIGAGRFADVYKGQLGNGVEIAVKVLKDTKVKQEMEKDFMAEVRTLSKTHHRNLVKLYGFCFEPKIKAFVYEYMENGSFDKILLQNPASRTWNELYDIAIQTSKALAYLHENCEDHIIHRDIKAGNVLLDSKGTPKITDFGLAKLYNIDKSQVTFTGPREMRYYDAPEVRMGTKKITYKCDVYSYGMMLFDILREGNRANQNLSPRLVWENLEQRKLDKFMTDCGIGDKEKEGAKTLSIVALWCLQLAPKDRPYMSNVVKFLEGKMVLPSPPNPFVPSSPSSSRSTGSGALHRG